MKISNKKQKSTSIKFRGGAEVKAGELKPDGATTKLIALAQQEPDLRKGLCQPGEPDFTLAVFARKMRGQFLQDLHVLGEAIRDVWLQDFENAPFPAPARWVAPGESQHSAHACFRKNRLGQLDAVGLHPVTQLPGDNRADLIGAHIGDAVFEFRKRLA